MRINVYSQELYLAGGDHLVPGDTAERVVKVSNTGLTYHAVRMFLHSSRRLHHPPADDDRSAITFWLPKSQWRREILAIQFERLANLVRTAPPETGLD